LTSAGKQGTAGNAAQNVKKQLWGSTFWTLHVYAIFIFSMFDVLSQGEMAGVGAGEKKFFYAIAHHDPPATDI